MRSSDWSSDVCSSDLYSLSDGRDGLRALLAAPGPQPTAVIGGNDLLAIGVMLEAQQSGLSVPDDLSVAGFDDIELAANFAPALTTVHVPVEEICALAGDYLDRKSGVSGTSVSVRVDPGGRRLIKKKNK